MEGNEPAILTLSQLLRCNIQMKATPTPTHTCPHMRNHSWAWDYPNHFCLTPWAPLCYRSEERQEGNSCKPWGHKPPLPQILRWKGATSVWELTFQELQQSSTQRWKNAAPSLPGTMSINHRMQQNLIRSQPVAYTPMKTTKHKIEIRSRGRWVLLKHYCSILFPVTASV